ncbi:MAG TPA: DNA-binding protein [Candidatus Limnocylindria bacterium]|nr:DNA-binding protein [Candidatus Limnocylindria bacterium]
MKKFGRWLSIGVITALLGASSSFAQPGPGMKWRGSGGWGPGSQYNRMYDPKAVETISGEVTAVDRIMPMKGMSGGVHINVKTDKETISVQLGPSWYLENQDVKIEAKDKVEVKGARTTFAGKPAIIAAEVKKGDEVLKLRDDNGYPVWSGWRRR